MRRGCIMCGGSGEVYTGEEGWGVVCPRCNGDGGCASIQERRAEEREEREREDGGRDARWPDDEARRPWRGGGR